MRSLLFGAALLALVGAAGSATAQTLVVDNVDSGGLVVWGGSSATPPNRPCTDSNPIILGNPIFVKSGSTLRILAGCVVRGQPRSGPVVAGSVVGSPGALIVTRSGRIEIQGTSTSPVIMTTAAIDNNGDNVADSSGGFELPWTVGTDVFYDDTPRTAPLAPLNALGEQNTALWGGLVVLGNAPTNLSDVCGLEIGECTIEGLTIPGFPVADATYGGQDPHDNSGIIRYVSVRHAGDEIGEGNELNGITLGGVGDGTTFEFSEVYVNFDDGIEWFGGTVNGNNLAVTFAGDDTFDLDQGYTGVNQFLFGLMPFFNENDGGAFGTGSGDKAGEFDGDDFDEPGSNVNLAGAGGGPVPLSAAVMLNATIIGSTTDGANPATSPASANRGIQFRNGFAGQVRNSIVINTGSAQGFDIDAGGAPGFSVLDNFAAGLVKVCASTFDDGAALPGDETSVVTTSECTGLSSPGNVVNAVAFPGLINEDSSFVPTGTAGNKLASSLKASKINPRPNAGLTGVAGGVVASEPGTEGVTFRGAFARTAPALWTTGWHVLWLGGLLAD